MEKCGHTTAASLQPPHCTSVKLPIPYICRKMVMETYGHTTAASLQPPHCTSVKLPIPYICRKMVMETCDKVVRALGTADIDARLEELLIDGILYAYQEQVGGCLGWEL